MNELTIAVPHSAGEAAILQAEAEADLVEVKTMSITNDDTFKAFDVILTSLAQRKDAALAMQRSATGPMYKAAKVVELWFKPLTSALDEGIAYVKAAMGAYRVAEDAKRREAATSAAALADGDNGAALVEALTTAGAAPAAARATTRYGWKVLRIVEDMLPDEYWTPDLARLDIIAKKAGSSEEPPIVPGVVFERTAQIGARR